MILSGIFAGDFFRLILGVRTEVVIVLNNEVKAQRLAVTSHPDVNFQLRSASFRVKEIVATHLTAYGGIGLGTRVWGIIL